jgi:hypothetical protein
VIRRLGRGDWTPRTTHPTLLAVQLVALWQAGLRGLDYVGGTVAGLDRAAGNPLYGWLLYASTVLVLAGLAAHRGGPVILGHALLGSWYLGLGVDTLRAVDLNGYLTGGLLLGGVGAWALVDGTSWPHRFAGVAGMLLGQWLLVEGLGVDYRAGTGLIAAGLLHGTLAVGTFVLWQRQRLRRVVDDERAPGAD